MEAPAQPNSNRRSTTSHAFPQHERETCRDAGVRTEIAESVGQVELGGDHHRRVPRQGPNPLRHLQTNLLHPIQPSKGVRRSDLLGKQLFHLCVCGAGRAEEACLPSQKLGRGLGRDRGRRGGDVVIHTADRVSNYGSPVTAARRVPSNHHKMLRLPNLSEATGPGGKCPGCRRALVRDTRHSCKACLSRAYCSSACLETARREHRARECPSRAYTLFCQASGPVGAACNELATVQGRHRKALDGWEQLITVGEMGLVGARARGLNVRACGGAGA